MSNTLTASGPESEDQMYKIVATVKPTTKGRVGAGTLSREYQCVDDPSAAMLKETRAQAEKDFRTLYGCSGTADITVRRA